MGYQCKANVQTFAFYRTNKSPTWYRPFQAELILLVECGIVPFKRSC